MTITPEEVAKLAAAATPGPWCNTVQSGEITDAKGYYIGRAMLAGTSVGRANAAFIAAAHDMAALIAEQDRLLKLADDMADSPTAEDEDALAAVVAYRAAREALRRSTTTSQNWKMERRHEP